MSKNHIATGNVMPFTPAAAVASGQLVLVGTVLLVSCGAYAQDDPKAQGHVSGVWQVPKLGTDDVDQGVDLYFDEATGEVTLDADSGNNVYAGKSWMPAGDTVDTVQLWLNAPGYQTPVDTGGA